MLTRNEAEHQFLLPNCRRNTLLEGTFVKHDVSGELMHLVVGLPLVLRDQLKPRVVRGRRSQQASNPLSKCRRDQRLFPERNSEVL